MKIETIGAADRELSEAVKWYDAKRLGLGDEFLEVMHLHRRPRYWRERE